MTQKTRCPECGARLSVPDTGLTMTCDYCGCSQPVPDADKRRKKIEREENQQRQAEKTAQKAQVKIENHLLQKRKKRWNAVTGSITTIGGVLVCLIILGFILYKKGTLDVFFGDGGAQALEKIAKKLRQGGQKILTDKRHERFYYDFKRIEIKLEKDRCYTLAIAANKRVFHVVLRARPSLVQYPNHKQVTLPYCAKKTAKTKVAIALLSPGQFSWALFLDQNKKPPVIEGTPKKPSYVVQFAKKCKVRKNPSRRSRSVGKVSPDTSYPLLEQKGSKLRKIRLPDGVEGWTRCPLNR